MPINFPASPAVNDTYSYGSRTWQWDGIAWKQISLAFGPPGPAGATGPTGPSAQTLGITEFAGATYTITSADVNRLLYMSNTAPGLVTVGLNSMSKGQQAQVVRAGTGSLTIAGAAGVTILSSANTSTTPILRVAYSAASIVCINASTFLVSGDIV